MVGKGSRCVQGRAVRCSGRVIGACSFSGLWLVSGNAEILFGCPFNRQTWNYFGKEVRSEKVSP